LEKAKDWYSEKIIQTTLDNLKKNGFTTLYASTKEEATKKLLDLIPKEAKVGLGGSVTLREIGLVKALYERGSVLADHWRPGISKEESKQTRLNQLTSDVFLTSSNAITMDGKLLNIDGTGNRVGSMIFGPRRVIIVAGANKIVKDLDEALKRVRNVATPMNANRLKHKSPCALTGVCAEEQCETPERLCHIITILERRPSETDTTVLLVGERLGY